MNENDTSSLETLIEELSQKLKEIIDKGLESREFQPFDDDYYITKVSKFEYTETGPKFWGIKSEKKVIKNWRYLYQKILKKMVQTKKYQQLFSRTQEIRDNAKRNQEILDLLLQNLVKNYVYDPGKYSRTLFKELSEKFLIHIEEQIFQIDIEIALQGVILFPDKQIEFKDGEYNFLLRRTTIDDLSYEGLDSQGFEKKLKRIPSAFLKISCLKYQIPIKFPYVISDELDKLVRNFVKTLSLFKLGCVTFYSYMISDNSLDSTLSFFTPNHVKRLSNLFHSLLLNKNDTKGLQSFWKYITTKNKLSKSLDSANEYNAVKLAHRNYQNALFFADAFKEKIAYIVMGFEALFLSGEKNELSFRLKTRICKLFSYFNSNTIELNKLLGIAYMIRSKFVHAAKYSKKDKKTLAKFSDRTNQLLVPLANYLREAILIFIEIDSKILLLKKIDKALINEIENTELKKEIIEIIKTPLFQT